MTIKVLHIVLSMETGGLENGIVNLINRTGNEFQIDILCLRARGELADRITNKNTRVFFDEQMGSGLVSAISKVKKLCRQESYDIIHSHGFTTMVAGYVGGKLSRTPFIINGEHGVLFAESAKKRIIQRLLFNRMDLNLTVSAALREEIKQVFSVKNNRFKAIINGVDSDKFAPNTQARSEIRYTLGLDESQILIGSVGRLVDVKNYPNLLRAFHKVTQMQPSARLALTGDGVERTKLENLAKELNITDKVFFLGRRDDIAQIMNAYDLFVLPSFKEGLSNTLLEAMSSGLPVIATQVGGNSEIVAEEKTGYLYSVNNDQELTDCLMSFISDPALTLKFSKNARQHIIDNFTLQNMVDNYNNTYKALTKSRLSGNARNASGI